MPKNSFRQSARVLPFKSRTREAPYLAMSTTAALDEKLAGVNRHFPVINSLLWLEKHKPASHAAIVAIVSDFAGDAE